jgi:hypothetical protein
MCVPQAQKDREMDRDRERGGGERERERGLYVIACVGAQLQCTCITQTTRPTNLSGKSDATHASTGARVDRKLNRRIRKQATQA